MARDLGRALVVGFLGVVLLLSLLGANLVVGVDRTALEGDFVKESLEAEDGYAVLLEEMQAGIAKEQEPADGTAEGEPDPEELLGDALTEEYVREQTDANVDRLYAYLHDEREELYLAFETAPLKDDLAAELAESLVDVEEIAETDPRFAALRESETEFEATRAEFEEEQKQRIQEETTPYLTDEELEEAYDESREEIREEAIAELEADLAQEEYPPAVERAALELGTVYVDGLIEADLTYGEFIERVENAEATLLEAAETEAHNQLDEELPDTVELTEGLTDEDRQELETVRDGVSLLGLLAIVLPVIALVVSALVGWVTVTRSTSLLVVGSASALAGAVPLAGLTVLQDVVVEELESAAGHGEIQPEFVELLLGLLDRTLAVFFAQSWVLVGLGLVLVVGGIAIRTGIVPVADRPTSGSDVGTVDGDDGSVEIDDGTEDDGTEDDESGKIDEDREGTEDGSDPGGDDKSDDDPTVG